MTKKFSFWRLRGGSGKAPGRLQGGSGEAPGGSRRLRVVLRGSGGLPGGSRRLRGGSRRLQERVRERSWGGGSHGGTRISGRLRKVGSVGKEVNVGK